MLSQNLFPLVVVTIIILLCMQKYVSSLGLLQKIGNGVGEPRLQNIQDLPPDEWFEQKLDHFMPTNTKTWKQRYGTNSTFYKPGGPVFLMIGGEGEANPKWLIQGEWIINAQRFSALCFQLEHRFYGKSHPTSDMSIENLIYLTSEQALADIAYFITGMNSKYKLSFDTKWIAFGGSYPGSLAAWVRMKYPYLVYAAVSSSGPLLALLDFHQYNEVVQDALSTYSKECVSQVKAANKQISALLGKEDGRSYLEKTFKLCDKIDIRNKNDIQNLYQSLADNVVGIVQYNKDNKESVTANITIDTICDIMTSETKNQTSVQKYGNLNSLLLSVTEQTCLDYKYNNFVKNMSDVKWESQASEGGRQWTYQTCTEFGFYQTSSKESDLFGAHFPLEFFINLCTDLFGSRFNRDLLKNAVERSNIFYGALSANVGNIVFVHGSIDPWHALGITSSNKDKAYDAIFINGTAHCANMYPPSNDDLLQLKNARTHIAILLENWINGDGSKLKKENKPPLLILTYKYYPEPTILRLDDDNIIKINT